MRRDEITMGTQNNILSGDQNRPRRLPSFSDTHRIAISAHQFKYFAQKLFKSTWHNRQNWLNSPALSDLPLVIRFAVITWLVYWTRGLLAGPCHRPDEGCRHTSISAPEIPYGTLKNYPEQTLLGPVISTVTSSTDTENSEEADTLQR